MTRNERQEVLTIDPKDQYADFSEPPTQQHNCTLFSPYREYGIAVDVCYENSDGTYWVSNYEYASQVNYCPVCGAKAPKQVEQPR